ncbi:AraC family transcriptional regulator [Metasolibacillus sp. FSL K6-0083]|uniref:AraC family transcriptional regulator n=1 Tax=Metasolibacillus sp. FSL K6-0083 TaxID=2921416 RepID=UPI00315A2EA1
MNYEAHMLLWENTYAKIKKIDYAYQTNATIQQVMPYSALLVIVGGNVDLCLGQTPYHIQNFSIFHVGKSEFLDMKTTESYSYYMIYYQGDVIYLDAFIQHLYIEYRPFHTNFSCLPANPIAIELLLRDMYNKWKTESFQEHLSVKAIFYELIYRIFREFTEGQGKSHEVDLAETARRYIEQHVHEAVTVQKLADSLNISTRHLLRIFRERYGEGPQNYLQKMRLTLAQKYLQSNSMSIKEIAAALGYEDEYYFSRVFKKQLQITPTAFRLKYLANMSDFPITNDNHFQYNENQLVQAIRLESREYRLMKQTFIHSIRVPFIISLIALLAACGNDETEKKAEQVIKGEAETRVITDLTGEEIEIPTNPERIVLQGNAIGDLLALGIEPVGVDRRFIDSGVIENNGKIAAADIGYPTNLEKVVTLNPDLIMLGYVLENEVEEASKIAPTVVFNGMLPLKERLPIVANIIGKKTEAEEVLKNYEENAEAMWEQLRANGLIAEGETAVVLQYYWNKMMYVMKTGGVADLIYSPMGFAMDEKVEELQPNSGPYIEISEETMHDLLIGDHLFVLISVDEEAKNSFKELQEKPLWKSLPAVKNNKVHYIEDKWNYTDMTTSNMLLERFPTMLTE